jgi:hypothetical protein
MLIKFSIWLTHLFPFLKLIASSFAGFMLIFILNLGIEGAIGIGLLAAITFIGMSGLVAWLLINAIASRYDMSGLPITDLVVWGAFLATGVVIALSVLRFFTPVLEKIKRKLTLKTSMERNTKIDVRRITDFLPKGGHTYNPEKYFKKGDYFLGLNEKDKPIYYGSGRLPHVQIAGSTGTGKGVFIGMLESQALLNGATVVNIDPKNDEFGAQVLYQAAKKADAAYHFIDLRQEAPPQLNLFQNCSEYEIFSMFESAFSLSPKGGDSDFFRIADRRAAKLIAKKAATGNFTPSQLYADFEPYLTKEAPGFGGYLEEMASLNAVNAKQGLDLDEATDEGAAIYVIGSTRNSSVIAMQRMLLVKLILIAERRERMGTEKPRQIMAVVDELSYQISATVIESLKTSRDKGLNLIMAHQSMSDLRSGPKDLDAQAVEGAVMENGTLKLIYRVEDVELCKKLAEKTGPIQVDDEARTVRKNIALAESVDSERVIRQSERSLITAEMFGNLPKGVGVVFGVGLAQFTLTSPMQLEKEHPEAYQLQEAEGVSLSDLQDTPDNRFPA